MCLGDEFRVDTTVGDTRDSYLVERGIETFFIVPHSQTPQLPSNRVAAAAAEVVVVVVVVVVTIAFSCRYLSLELET